MPANFRLAVMACASLIVVSMARYGLSQSSDSRETINPRIKASKLNGNGTLPDRASNDRHRKPIGPQDGKTSASVPAQFAELSRLPQPDLNRPKKQLVPAHSASFSGTKPSDQSSDAGAATSDQETDDQTDEGESDDAEDQEPWVLFPLPRLEQHDVRVRGWFAQGFTWNPDAPADRTNGVLGMNDRSNDYLFNQLGLTIDKPVKEDPCNWSVGWRIALMYGADARFVQSLGFDDDWNSGRFVALAMPELYTDVFVPWGNGASLRLGRFWTPIGYEGVPPLERFFHSASNMYMLAEPSTHTGGILKYPLNEQWTVQAGMVLGWDVWRDNNDSLGAIGTLGWVSHDERTTVTGIFYSGDETDTLDDNQFTYSFIFTHDLTERWLYVFCNDFNTADDVATSSTGSLKAGQWFSVANNLFYAVNDCVSVGSRFEYYRDDDGVTIFHPVSGANLGAGDLFGLTFGLNYTPTANWLIRPELRWDWANRVIPFDDLTDGQQFTASCDVVLQF